MFIWYPIDNGICSLIELQTVYSFKDLVEMNRFLDYKDEVHEEIANKAKREAELEKIRRGKI
jgi:hypothetical protein